VRVKGRPLDPEKSYRVTVPSFLADGGDSFVLLRVGRDRKEGPLDVDVLASYLTQQSSAAAPLDPSPGRRIDGDGCK
jgi:5'-nucleotidase